MRVSWLFGALVTFGIGYLLTMTLIGAILGLPLMGLSLLILLGGIFLPNN